MGRLDGKVAIVTGAAKGMGESHARVLAREGAKVVLTDIDDQLGRQVADDIGASAIFLHHDVTSRASWNEVVEQATNKFGPIDVLVNNAGYVGPFVHTADLDEAEYLRTISIDQHGVVFGMQAVIPGMVEHGGGSIINISSIAGLRHVPGTPNLSYTAAKFAVRGATKVAAVEYGRDGIRVNSIHPGGVLTPMLKAALTDDEAAAASASTPLGRLANPSEISGAVLFLASEDSSYVSGAEIVVDGGFTAQ